MQKNLADKFSDLNDTFKDYLNLRVKLIKLKLLEKLTKMSMSIINIIVLLLFVTIFFFLFSAAFIVWYGTTTGDYLTGIIIVIGITLLLAIIFLLLRKTLITSSLIRQISAILFEDEDKN